jgi:hypothetical protein
VKRREHKSQRLHFKQRPDLSRMPRTPKESLAESFQPIIRVAAECTESDPLSSYLRLHQRFQPRYLFRELPQLVRGGGADITETGS